MLYPFLEVLFFLVCIVFCFYIPGRLVSIHLKLKLDGLESLFVSTVTGMVLFLALLYPLAWLHAEWFSLLVYVGCVFLAIRERRKLFVPITRTYLYPSFFLGVSAVIFSLSLVLWGQYGHTVVFNYDDLWHLALIQEMRVNFPPDIPTYAGLHLTGYHFFTDFFLANVSKLFFISPLSLHFHLFPILLSALWALGVFVFVSAWAKKTSAALWAVFLTMFAGSFAFILQLQGHPLNLTNGLDILQPADSVYNPPLTFSIVLLLFALFLLYRYIQTREKRWMVPFIFVLGLLPMIKVYAGMLLFGGFSIVMVSEFFKKRFFLLSIFILAFLIYLATYGVFVGRSGGLIWYPFWAPHDLLRSFTWYDYDNKMYIFAKEHVLKGLIETEAYGFILYIFGNLGTRIIGLLFLLLLLNKHRRPSIFTLSMVAMLLVAILLPLFFIQTGKVFEITQMANYYLFFCALFASLGLSTFFSLHFRRERLIKSLFFILFIVFTLSSAIASYQQVLATDKNKRDLTDPYFRSLAFLRKQGIHNQTILLVPPGTSVSAKSMHEWYVSTTPEVGAFADKRLFLAFGVFEYPGMNAYGRGKEIGEFFSKFSPAEQAAYLTKQHITYLFSPSPLPSIEQVPGIKKIYDDTYFIYQFSPK